jgi:hypothetical protein
MRISEKAMLVVLRISCWSGRRFDRDLTDEVCRSKSANRGAARVNKNLVEGSNELQAVARACGALRQFVYEQTLPWADTGARILPVGNYFKFSNGAGDLRRSIDAAVDVFVGAYPDIISRAKVALNGMFDPGDYLPQDGIRRLFSVAVDFRPMPEAADFRVELGDDETERIRGEIEGQLKGALTDAMADLWRRLREAVDHMAKKLGEPGAIFRDSLVGNVRELVDLIPRLNLTGDQDLETVAADVKTKLASLDPDVLRESEVDRALAADTAASIVRKMAGYTIGAGL